MSSQIFLTKVEFIMKLGGALHRYGTPAQRLEQALTLVAEKLNIHSQFFSTPTSIMASLRGSENEVTRVLRVQPGEVDLGKLTELDMLGDDAITGRISLAECSKRIDQISDRESIYGPGIVVASHGLSSFGVACLFQASVHDVAWASLIGCVVGLLSSLAKRSERIQRVFEASAAFLASAIATAAAINDPRVFTPTVILAGIIALIPGLSLTIALTELSTQHLIAGTARFMGALITLLKLVFGVVLGSTLISLYTKIPEHLPSTALPGEFVWLGLLFASLASVVIYRAPPRDSGWVMLASILGFLAAKLGTLAIGPTLGVFVGGFAIGAGSNIFARVLKRPAQTIVVPGIVLLVPGSMGYKSFSFFASDDVVSGVGSGFSMFLIAITIVAGVLFGNAFISPKRSL
jgi:uncharacterized membrane protein YjjP (DUF1212 family)